MRVQQKKRLLGGRMHAVCGTTTAGSAAKPGSRRRLRRWELREIAQLTTVLSVSGAVISFERRGIVVNLVQIAAGKEAAQAGQPAGGATWPVAAVSYINIIR